VAGVLRGDKSRFQLFGDTVSTLLWDEWHVLQLYQYSDKPSWFLSCLIWL
jgi:hypothetical protein